MRTQVSSTQTPTGWVCGTACSCSWECTLLVWAPLGRRGCRLSFAIRCLGSEIPMPSSLKASSQPQCSESEKPMLSAGLPAATAALRAPVLEMPAPTQDLLCTRAPSTMALGNASCQGRGPRSGGPHSSGSQPPCWAFRTPSSVMGMITALMQGVRAALCANTHKCLHLGLAQGWMVKGCPYPSWKS